ncbi:MAG: OmpA family protein [Bacteroidetes bacterium]|nr:OmpA family protein [Bacteroidota bacterium]MCL5739119.1 OmpA family protein [Bacteroidota bacterium]
MAGSDEGRAPINIIKKKKSGHVAHGGAWKVAYADFVTAMMALFIVLWIVGQSKQIKENVANYFKDPGAFNEKTQSHILSGGLVPVQNQSLNKTGIPIDKEAEELKTLSNEGKKLQQMISSTPQFKKFTNQIQITVSKEGLRIELIENAQGLFFDVGSARLKPETIDLLEMIARELSALPNQIIIEGYTDARPYVRTDYTNWELSTDRANAARKILRDGGLKKDQILEVRGYADRRLRDPANPYDFSNRRVSILVTPFTKDSVSTPAEHIDTLKIGG